MITRGKPRLYSFHWKCILLCPWKKNGNDIKCTYFEFLTLLFFSTCMLWIDMSWPVIQRIHLYICMYIYIYIYMYMYIVYICIYVLCMQYLFCSVLQYVSWYMSYYIQNINSVQFHFRIHNTVPQECCLHYAMNSKLLYSKYH